MTKSLQDFHFPNRCNREAILFLLRIDSLQRNNFSSFLMSANEDAPEER
jgi:hypothetical protein